MIENTSESGDIVGDGVIGRGVIAGRVGRSRRIGEDAAGVSAAGRVPVLAGRRVEIRGPGVIVADREVHFVVFSDDWGRHPSSSQHLIRHWLDRHPVLWVNTIGTRLPGLNREDMAKVMAKLRQWLSRSGRRSAGSEPALGSPTAQSEVSNLPGVAELPGAPGVPGVGRVEPELISPRMYPGFRRSWQRKLNRRLIGRAVNARLDAMAKVSGVGEGLGGGGRARPFRVAITTIPIVADLPGFLEVDAWVYYCVDDFSVWPGLDGSVMDGMERELVGKVDLAVAVGEVLVERLASMGCGAEVLSHGIDPAHWSGGTERWGDRATARRELLQLAKGAEEAAGGRGPRGGDCDPILLFWGYIDTRLDAEWCLAAADQVGSLILLGPKQSPDRRLAEHPRIFMPGPVAFDDLPRLAQAAEVLVMPYADLPVTRAMQPLKFKEYLATGRPVVARKLPATASWHDCCHVVDGLEMFLDACRKAAGGEGEQAFAAQRSVRLATETWASKSQWLLERILDLTR